MKVYFIMFILLIPTITFAQAEGKGNEGGNGGDVVICFNKGHELKPIVLDYFESKKKIKLGVSDDPFELVRGVLKQISMVDPLRARLYNEGLTNFLAESAFLENIELPEVRDEGRIRIYSKHEMATRCYKQQAVIQFWKPEYQENFESWTIVRKLRYLIDKNLWDKLDAKNKAGLILHELLVREGVNLRETKNTRDIRRINRYMSTFRAEGVFAFQYESVMASLGFPVFPDN